MGQDVFTGAAGQTAFGSTTVWCASCGTWYGGRWLRSLDADADPDRLAAVLADGLGAHNLNRCPSCGAPYVVEEPLAVHRPGERELVLVVPPGRLHRAQQARAALIAAVADGPGDVVPRYALEPTLVRGVAGLRALMGDDVRTVTVPRARPSAPVSAPAEPAPPPAPKPAEPSPMPGGLLAALADEADETAGGPSAWDDQWSLDGSADATQTEHEPTRVSRISAPRLPIDAGAATRLGVDDGDVIAVARAAGDDPQAELDAGALRFQLHRTAAGLAACLTLVPEAGEPRCWVVDPTDGERVLERLARRFEVTVDLVDSDGVLVARRVFESPLTLNVAVARALLDRAGGSPAAAREAVERGEVELVGELRHNFREDTFDRCESASDAHLALGIVGFWAEPEREHYLLWVQSFPRVWFEAIVRRVLIAALDHGLLPPTHLETRALELGLAPDARALVSRALASFAEASLSVSRTRNDLDPIDTYENWERLLTRAEALGLAVDAGVRGLAFNAMEAARQVADAVDASEEAMELDLDDEVIELDAIELESIDEPHRSAPAAGGDHETTDRLDDLIDTALIGLLDDPERRAGAAAELLRRGETLYAPTIAEVILEMDGPELARVLPNGLAMAEALAGHLVVALHGGDPVRRRAITLFLAEAGRLDVAPSLVDQLLDARDQGWPMLATSLARLGDDIRHLIAGLPLDGGALERVARVLAGLPADVRRTVYDAGAMQSALVRRCLARSELLAGETPPSLPFARRLDEALTMMVAGDTITSKALRDRGGDGASDFE